MNEVRRFGKIYVSESQGLKSGNFTLAMWVALGLMRTWANYNTGVVPYVSATGLNTIVHNQISTAAFHEALRRLEAMGYITRHWIKGEKGSYEVTLHNFEVTKWTEDKPPEMYIETINEKKILTWKQARKQAKRLKSPTDEATDQPTDRPTDDFAADNTKQESYTSSEDGRPTERPTDEANKTRLNIETLRTRPESEKAAAASSPEKPNPSKAKPPAIPISSSFKKKNPLPVGNGIPWEAERGEAPPPPPLATPPSPSPNSDASRLADLLYNSMGKSPVPPAAAKTFDRFLQHQDVEVVESAMNWALNNETWRRKFEGAHALHSYFVAERTYPNILEDLFRERRESEKMWQPPVDGSELTDEDLEVANLNVTDLEVDAADLDF